MGTLLVLAVFITVLIIIYHKIIKKRQKEPTTFAPDCTDIEQGNGLAWQENSTGFIKPYNTYRNWGGNPYYSLYSQNNKLWVASESENADEANRRVPLGQYTPADLKKMTDNAYSQEIMCLSASWADTLSDL